MRLVWPLSVFLLLSCTQPSGSPGVGVAGGLGPDGLPGPATPPPQPAATSNVTIGDPSGIWKLGSSAEPPAGPVVACQLDQTLTLAFDSGRLQGSVDACASTCHQVESLDGTYSEGSAQLVGTSTGNLDATVKSVIYLLKFNPATQHLVGTRNGLAVWAVPFVPSNLAECQPSPTPEPVPTIETGTIIPGGDP